MITIKFPLKLELGKKVYIGKNAYEVTGFTLMNKSHVEVTLTNKEEEAKDIKLIRRVESERDKRDDD
jgi:hypothetical protein